MSTKALRTVVSMLGCSGTPEKCLHCGAEREVEAIEDAARAIVATVAHSADDEGFEVLESIAKEALAEAAP